MDEKSTGLPIKVGKKKVKRIKTRLATAREYQRQIAKLQKEREKLYAQALKELGIADTNMSFDWFFNEQSGHCGFTEGLKE